MESSVTELSLNSFYPVVCLNCFQLDVLIIIMEAFREERIGLEISIYYACRYSALFLISSYNLILSTLLLSACSTLLLRISACFSASSCFLFYFSSNFSRSSSFFFFEISLSVSIFSSVSSLILARSSRLSTRVTISMIGSSNQSYYTVTLSFEYNSLAVSVQQPASYELF